MTERNKSNYENYDEKRRQFYVNAHLPRYLTTIRYFDKLFTPGSRILDACAGTGKYSFYLAERGHSVTACDLVEHHVNIIKSAPNANKLAGAMVCNVLDLSQFEDESFDIVLCIGVMHHLPLDDKKILAIRECTRVCKLGGLVVLSYLNYFEDEADDENEGQNNIERILAEFEDDGEHHLEQSKTPAKMERFATGEGLEILHNIGDGLSMILHDKENDADTAEFQEWMEFIYKHCEDPDILGYSTHGLLICKKRIK